MSENLLTIRNLNVTYDTEDAVIYAVNGLNLTVKKGETLGLVGETGAGKTTTALSIMKLLPKNIGKIVSGEIIFDGMSVTEMTEADMRLLRGEKISMIFQDPMTSLNPLLTIGEQIYEVLELHALNKTKEEKWKRVDEILRMVGLPAERRDEYPHQFSGGMKQRVVIAIALACEPQLLLADEPTTALDVTIQAQVLEMMHELKGTLGTAMVLITHDLGVVAETCDRVAIMYAGEIIELGTLENIFDGSIHHPYTRGLFGSIPDLKKSARRLTPIDGLMPDPSCLPEGCRFHTRCPDCMEVCKTTSPGAYENNGHQIHCHLYASKNMR